MTPRSLFIIIIKIIGIYLVISAIVLLPQLLSTINSFRHEVSYFSQSDILSLGFWILFAVLFYALVLRYCLFKTDWLVDKLHLDKGFTEEKFELNIHRSTVLRIAVVVIGSVMVIDNLPLLCKEAFVYFQTSAPDRGFKENTSSKWIIFDFVKLFVGFFLMTTSRLVVNFIELKRKKPAQVEEIE